jgi:hypothetical protein
MLCEDGSEAEANANAAPNTTLVSLIVARDDMATGERPGTGRTIAGGSGAPGNRGIIAAGGGPMEGNLPAELMAATSVDVSVVLEVDLVSELFLQA